MLPQLFKTTARHYTDNDELIAQSWTEIADSYSAPHRHYHTLTHLAHVYEELEAVKPNIQHWDSLMFSLFYHDVIYDPSQHDNEEASALLAIKRLSALQVPDEIAVRCSTQILATKKHEAGTDRDTDLLTDADLAILGQSSSTYEVYCQQIRKEYQIYPDPMYNFGRRKVLLHFLEMERIFKTDWFFNKYEHQARENLRLELQRYS